MKWTFKGSYWWAKHESGLTVMIADTGHHLGGERSIVVRGTDNNIITRLKTFAKMKECKVMAEKAMADALAKGPTMFDLLNKHGTKGPKS